MTLLLAAGPSCRLQFLRQRRDERAAPDHRFIVWLLTPEGPRTLYAGTRYRAAREAFEIEAAYQGWKARPVARTKVAA